MQLFTRVSFTTIPKQHYRRTDDNNDVTRYTILRIARWSHDHNISPAYIIATYHQKKKHIE